MAGGRRAHEKHDALGRWGKYRVAPLSWNSGSSKTVAAKTSLKGNNSRLVEYLPAVSDGLTGRIKEILRRAAFQGIADKSQAEVSTMSRELQSYTTWPSLCRRIWRDNPFAP